MDQHPLTAPAAELLVSAASDDGVVMFCDFPATLYAKGRNFLDGASARKLAKWRAAFQELRSLDYVEHIQEDAYAVTNQGYLAADVLMAAASDS